MRRKQFIHRNRRSAAEEVDDVLKEIAAEEIDEVDIIMEDINDEINDLQDSIDEKDSPCSISHNQVIKIILIFFFKQKINFELFFRQKVIFYFFFIIIFDF